MKDKLEPLTKEEFNVEEFLKTQTMADIVNIVGNYLDGELND